MVEKKANALVFSSVVLAVLVYARIIPLPEHTAVSAFREPDIAELSGTVASNPVKISEKYYSALLKTKSCKNRQNMHSSCTGSRTVFIPASIVESHYPDKLYSALKNADGTPVLPIEKGAEISVSGKSVRFKTGENVFITENVLLTEFSPSIAGKIQKQRALLRLQFKRLMSYWGKAGGLLLALLTGSREYLDKSFSSLFRQSGLSHILALSGMHLTAMAAFAGIFEKRTSFKKAGRAAQFAAVSLFVWFAGLSPSLLRAFISYVLISLCAFFNVKIKSQLNILACTFLIHAAAAPSDLFNIGFLLSYSAVAGIVIASPLVNIPLKRCIPPLVSENVSTSVSANLFTFPVVMRSFGFFSPAGIICTLFISPIVTVFLYAGIILTFLSFFSPLICQISNFALNFMYTLMEKTVGFWSFIPAVQLY